MKYCSLKQRIIPKCFNVTFSRLVTDVDGVGAVIVGSALRVLDADQVGIGGAAKVPGERQDVIAGIREALQDLIVPVLGYRDRRVLVLHVYRQAAYLRERVREIPEILQGDT